INFLFCLFHVTCYRALIFPLVGGGEKQVLLEDWGYVRGSHLSQSLTHSPNSPLLLPWPLGLQGGAGFSPAGARVGKKEGRRGVVTLHAQWRRFVILVACSLARRMLRIPVQGPFPRLSWKGFFRLA
ncbi:MAG: hypothetical protein DRP85_08350, partial [Candidatus Makaraimicrobium thalassicum]